MELAGVGGCGRLFLLGAPQATLVGQTSNGR